MLKKNVLRKKEDFKAVYNKGKSFGDRFTVLFIKKNGLDYNRTGILASKKVGNSVCRNRARRLIRESYRHLTADLPVGYDFIIIARATISGKKCMDVEKSLTSCFIKAGVLRR